MFKQIKEFFFGTPKETVKKDETKVEAVNAAPYKVEAPVVVTAAPVVAKSTKPKAPAKKRTFVKRDEKPAAIKAPAKPRAPRAPKAK